MSEAKSEAPPLDLPSDLRAQRDEFVQNVYQRGVELTERLLQEHERLLLRIRDLERDNGRLAALVAAAGGDAAAAVAPPLDERQGAIEEELATLANVYVAGQQLASTLELPHLLRHMRELLNQLVGSRSFAVYLLDDRRENLVYLTGEAPPPRYARSIPLEGAPGDPIVALLEKAVLAGMAHIAEDPHDPRHAMAACLPMRFGEAVVGAIAIFAVLAQKLTFMPVDYELFRLLSSQGTSFLFLAQMYAEAGRTLPSTDRILARAAEERGPARPTSSRDETP